MSTLHPGTQTRTLAGVQYPRIQGWQQLYFQSSTCISSSDKLGSESGPERPGSGLEALSSSAGKHRTPGDNPHREATSARISSTSRLSLARRFWNQVTTCALARPSRAASPSRSDGAKYFWKTNRRSSSSTCCAVNAVRDLRRLRTPVPGPGGASRAALPARMGRKCQSPALEELRSGWKNVGSRGSSRCGGRKGAGQHQDPLHTGSGPGFEVQQACGSAGDREMRLLQWVEGGWD